jgi:hypothetical protein
LWSRGLALGADIVPLAAIYDRLIGVPIAVIATEQLGLTSFVKYSIDEMRKKYLESSVGNTLKLQISILL